MSNAVEDRRRAASRWRSTVSMYLRSVGVDATARPAARTYNDNFLSMEPDVVVSGFHVLAPVIPFAKVGDYLLRCTRAADEVGAGDVPVLVLPRQTHEPGDAYCVLRLSDVATLMGDAQKARTEAPEASPDLAALVKAHS